MKRAIVTGGNGFIGSRLVNELVSRGVEVTILTSKSADEKKCSNDLIKTIYTTYNDYSALIPKMEKGYDVFYHLGWAGVAGKEKNNIPLQLRNIEAGVNAISLSGKLKCRLFIGAGTVAEYVFNKDTIDFTLRQTPNDIYGATKVACHYLLEVIAKQWKQDMIWVVLPSTFGEGRKEDNILTYTIVSLLRKERPIYGNLEQMWDFLYVSEVARALADIGEYGKPGTTYGVGSGEYRPLKEYIKKVRDMINPKLPLGINELTDQPGHILSSCVNIEQLTKDTGFVPKISFEEGMRRTIKYYREILH